MNDAPQAGAFTAEYVTQADPLPESWLRALPPVADCLRPYQRRQVEQTNQALESGYRRILLQGATGSGKTHIISAIVAAACAADIPVLILATRTRLVRQLHERLEAFGIRHGTIAAPLPNLRDYSAKVQVASVDTLHRRSVVARTAPMPPAGLVIFDEAHLATADTRLAILDHYADAIRIGFTATPARKSGRSLGAAFDCLILGPSIRELTSAGMLVGLRIFNTPIASSKELQALPKDTDNDYQAGALGTLLSRPKLVGDVLENWLKIARGKRTLLFCVNKAHGGALLTEFLRQGIKAEMITDRDDEVTREDVLGRLERAETHIVINCFLLAYGIDVPSVECVVLARPTRSLTMYLQMVGRGLRPSSETGKRDCTLIDHGHVVTNLGLPSSDFGWTLVESRNVNREALERTRSKTAEAPRTCKQCSALWLTSEQGNVCPECGWTPTVRSKAITVQDADLAEMAEDDGRPTSPTDPRVVRFYQECLGWKQRHEPQKWADAPNKARASCWHATREKFKLAEDRVPHSFWALPASPASIDVAGYMKYRNIRWARSKSRAA